MLLEIRADDLRFTPAEAAALLKEVAAVPLSSEEINQLHGQADGWVVGLKMAGLVMQKQTDYRSFISGFTGTQRYIMDYLVDEVLKLQPAEISDFLLRTSVLDRFCGPLCDAVTQTSSSQEMLRYLEKANLFLIPLDSTGEWYRYHHLFRDLLQHCFRLESGEDGIKKALHRASAWFEANKFTEDAINHLLTAQNWDKAMDLIGTREIQARWAGTATMLHWLQQVPLEILRTHPMRYINYVFALRSTGQQEDAKQHLAYLEQVDIDDPLVQGTILRLHSAIALTDGDFEKMGEYARKTLALLEPLNKTKLNQDFDFQWMLADASFKLSLVYYQQARFIEAIPLLERCLKTYRELGITSAAYSSAAMLGFIMASCGKPREAIRLLQETIGPFAEDPATVLAHGALGGIYYELNDLEKAVFYYEQEIKLIQLLQIAPATMLPEAYLYLSQAKMARRDVEGSLQALEKADQLLSDTPEAKARNYAFHATIAMMQGDEDAASSYFDKFTRFETVPLMGMTPVAIYMFQIRGGKHVLLTEEPAYYDNLKSQGMWKFAMLARIYQALASDDNPEQAMVFLAEALALGKAQECIRTFVDFGAPMASLLREAISRGIAADYARQLLDIIVDEERWRQRLRTKTRITNRTDHLLSEREIEVLRLLAGGDTNQQIADKLTISLNTIHTHVYHILAKLDARHRLQAVARAKELKLI